MTDKPAEPRLREQAREAIRTGQLPPRGADRVIGGPGSGGICAVCGAMVLRSMTELEIQFDDGATARPVSYILHHRCFTAWEIERGAI